MHVRYLVMVQVRVSRYHDSFLNPHFWNSSFHRLRRKQKLDCHVIGNIFVNECRQAQDNCVLAQRRVSSLPPFTLVMLVVVLVSLVITENVCKLSRRPCAWSGYNTLIIINSLFYRYIYAQFYSVCVSRIFFFCLFFKLPTILTCKTLTAGAWYTWVSFTTVTTWNGNREGKKRLCYLKYLNMMEVI